MAHDLPPMAVQGSSHRCRRLPKELGSLSLRTCEHNLVKQNPLNDNQKPTYTCTPLPALCRATSAEGPVKPSSRVKRASRGRKWKGRKPLPSMLGAATSARNIGIGTSACKLWQSEAQPRRLTTRSCFSDRLPPRALRNRALRRKSIERSGQLDDFGTV